MLTADRYTVDTRQTSVQRCVMLVTAQFITAPRIPSGGQRKDFICTFIQHCSQPTGSSFKAARKSGCKTLAVILNDIR